ncbi:MAG: hypothetical protein AAF927_06725 [Bacteroidota bacterium]
MKQLLLFPLFCLLLLLQTQAQPPQGDKTRESGSAASMRTTLTYQLEVKQGELSNLLEAYELSTPARQSALKQKIRDNLYAQFDLSIRQKEAEVANLKNQLRLLQKSEAYEQKSGEIQQLQNSLQRIQGSLDFRKANREKIVEKRVKELLGE